jgi:hypothetical protein
MRDIDIKFKKDKPNRIYWEDIVANAILFNTTDKLFGRKNQDPIGDTNIKSHTVGYCLSYFHYLTNNKLDLGRIWRTQIVDEKLQIELKRLLIRVYHFLSNLDAALISEAAKSEKTWILLKGIKDFSLNMDIVKSYLISNEGNKTRYELNIDEVTETKKYETMEKITSLGLPFWDGLSIYMIRQDCLTVVQQNFAQNIKGKLSKNGTLTDIEIDKGGKIIDILINKNIDFENIRKLSKLEDKELVNPIIIYNRLKLIDNDTWKNVIALGEKTEKLSFKEISVIKTVLLKIKKQESIDLNRLQIVNDALEKMKKFGLKI